LKREAITDLSIEEGPLGLGRDKVLKSFLRHRKELVAAPISKLDFEEATEGAIPNRFH
jgi:hypothetical protein